jgi:RNA polymerase sigma-70 factor (ECF subfamily)
MATKPPEGGNPAPGSGAGQPGLETSVELLRRAQAGDRQALDRLCARHLPRLQRWAHGRLPHWARDLLDSDDIVQDTLLRTVRTMKRFEIRHDGALTAYLRQAVQNRIRDELRRVARRPGHVGGDREEADRGPSPLERYIGREALERYEQALQRLRPEEREAIVLRVELGYSYQELATALDKPSPDAARMATSRALVRLAEEMGS